MTITTTEEFNESDRYHYDRLLCPKGFAQLDTASDDWYFGIWANPESRIVFRYVEGDCITTQCSTDAEFTDVIRGIVAFHQGNDDFKGIDPGLEEASKPPWQDLGLGDLLH